MPLVASIVLTWNNFTDTDECIASLLGQDFPDHEVIVVDNGSDDGSLARLKERWRSKVRFIETGMNLGCGGGYNAGLKSALEAGADYCAIVDNDVVVGPDLIAELLRPFEGGERIGLTTPILTYFDEPGRVWFARGTYQCFFGFTRHPWIGKGVGELPELVGKVYSTDYAPSCAVMISREALDSVGLMDERFFFGHDDVDWCLRARRAGFGLVVVGRPLALHKVSTTGGTRGSTIFTSFSAYHHALGSMLIGAKHHRGLALVPYLVGQFAVRAPYYGLQMFRQRRWSGVAAYWQGLFVGAGRYLLRGVDSEPVYLSPDCRTGPNRPSGRSC